MGLLGALGEGLKKAGGLGLAGAEMVGQTAAQGLGLAPAQPQGMFGSPGEYKPTDFSDLNPLQNVMLRFQNAVAAGEGQPSASGQARAQRTAGNQQRVAAFTQGTEMLKQFDAIRDKASPEDYDRIDGLLKKRFAEFAGGPPGDADSMYDAFMSGGAGHAQALLKLVENDPVIQQGIASGWGVGEIRKAANEKMHEGYVFADSTNLPIVRKKIDAIFASGDPKTIELIQGKRGKESGRWTLDTLRDLNDQLPPELQMTRSQWETAKRHEGDLTDMPGIETTPEILEERKAGRTSDLKRQEKSAELSQQHKNRMDEIELEAILKPNKGNSPTANKGLEFAKWVETKRRPFFQAAADIQQVMSAPLNGFGDLQALYGFIKNQDNTAAREGELALAQTAASVADRVKIFMTNVGEGRKLDDKQRGEIRDILSGYARKVQGLHRDFLKRMKTTAVGYELEPDVVLPGWRDMEGAMPEASDAAPIKPKAYYSKSQNKTKLVYPDGREEIVDGRPAAP